MVANLSGGQCHGTAIGRAMHDNADLIVLYGPTLALIGAVDAELRTIVLYYLMSSEYF
jgi:ABC-type branched-subunit amino acid transport system ATPase component